MPAQIARRLDHRHLHAEANAEIRHLALARELRRRILPSAPRSPNPPGTRMPWTRSSYGAGSSCSNISASIQSSLTLHLVGDAAVRQRLDQRFVGVLQSGVFADDGDGDVAFRLADALVDHVPARKSGSRRLDAEGRQTSRVEPGGVIGVGTRRSCRRRAPRSPRFSRTLQNSAILLRSPAGSAGRSGTADVGLDADRAQFLDRMLRRLGLELAGASECRQQGQMDIDGVVARQVVADLPDRLEERQALDVADRAADLDQHEIEAVVAVAHEFLDGVGDVRDDLDGGAEIVAAPLFGDDVLINAAGGDVVLRRPARR